MNSHEPHHLTQPPAERHAPIPGWLLTLGVIIAFWAGGYLFFYSGGFRGDVFDPGQITWGPVSTGPVVPPDPKVIGKRLYTANCASVTKPPAWAKLGSTRPWLDRSGSQAQRTVSFPSSTRALPGPLT